MAEGCVEVVAGVIVRHGCVLVCQRPPEGHHPGKWEFPGGKVEPNESLERALRRELHEELNIDVKAGPVLWQTEHQYPGRERFTLTFLLVYECEGVPANGAFTTVRWAPIGTLSQYDFLEGDREFVEHLERGTIQLRQGPGF
jgi:8-oxo-dGTP diphosphatase